MIDYSLLIMYGVHIILLLDVKVNYLSTNKSASLLMKSSHKLFLYNLKQVIKRHYFQFVMILIYSVFCVYINKQYLSFAMMGGLLLLWTPSSQMINHKLNNVIYVIPLLNTVENMNETIGVSLFIMSFILMILIPDFKSVYNCDSNFSQTRRIKILLNTCAVIAIIYLIIHFEQELLTIKFPLELIVFMMILMTIARIEAILKHNRIILLKFRSRFYLNIMKKERLSIRLMPKNILKQIGKEGFILLMCVALSIFFKGKRIEGIVLVMAILLQFISVLDIIIFYDVLQCSVIYANKVTREMIVLGIDMIVFQYLAYYLIQNQWSQTVLPSTIKPIKYLYGIIIMFFIIMYVFRIRKIFRINRGD